MDRERRRDDFAVDLDEEEEELLAWLRPRNEYGRPAGEKVPGKRSLSVAALAAARSSGRPLPTQARRRESDARGFFDVAAASAANLIPALSGTDSVTYLPQPPPGHVYLDVGQESSRTHRTARLGYVDFGPPSGGAPAPAAAPQPAPEQAASPRPDGAGG